MTYDELDAKAEAIARILAPWAFMVAYDGTGPDAKQLAVTVREQYQQSEARTKAWQILEALSLATEEHRLEGWRREFNRRGFDLPPDCWKPSR